MLLSSRSRSLVFKACSIARRTVSCRTFTYTPFAMDHLRTKLTALTPNVRKHKVTVVGSGNWGSTIAKVVAENTNAHPELFERDVQMWVYEEEVELNKESKHYSDSHELSKGPQKLTRVINELHENVKYLPGVTLPTNVVANPSITDAVHNSTILIFNLPHQFIVNLCKQIKGSILPFARGISCIKGVNVHESSISLFSETIGQELGIYCGALSGANIANEVAQEKFSETTIAYDPPAIDSQAPTPSHSQSPSPASSHVDLTQLVHKDVHGRPSKAKLRPLPSEYHAIDKATMKKLFHRRYFQVRVTSDVAGVSLGGALKNIIAVAAGWVEGLGWGDNAKAAIMRIGLLEMVEFGKRFFKQTVSTATFTQESAGVADLITTCSGGRHTKCAKLSIIEGKPIKEIEERELNGQKLQGTLTAYEVNTFLKSQGMEKDFPLFTAVYQILEGKVKAEDLPSLIESESERKPQGIERLSYERATPPPPEAKVQLSSPATAKSTPTVTTQLQPQLPPPSTSPHPSLIPPPPLATSRYARQLLVPNIRLTGQHRLSASSILIIGLGGLGSPAALYLAGSGIGRLGFVDADVVELSNLHRQIVHTEARVGMNKVASAIEGCKALNSEVRYVGYEERLSSSNVLRVMQSWDVVLDCTDNPATRYLISDACVALGKVLVSGAAQRVEGQMMVLNYAIAGDEGGDGRRGPCYRCVFPKPPSPDMVRGCSEIGVLGPAVGVVGTLMAGAAVSIVVEGEGYGRGRKPCMLLYNAWTKDPKGMWRTVSLRGRRGDCVACGEEDVLREKGLQRIDWAVLQEERLDYELWCGRTEDLLLLTKDKRVGARDFLTGLQRANAKVIDVREEIEYELGPKVEGSINIPIAKIMRDAQGAFSTLWREDQATNGIDETGMNSSERIYFVCQRGNDSQIAAQKLMGLDDAMHRNSGWIGDVEGGFLAIERVIDDRSGV